MPNRQSAALPLPPPVLARLGQIAAEVRRTALRRLLVVTALALESAGLALYLFDHYGETPPWARLVLFELALGSVLLAAVAGWRCLRRVSVASACARQAMHTDERLGHLLLSAVELASAPPEAAASALRQAALGQIAAACTAAPSRRLAGPPPRPRLGAALILCTAALLPALLGSPATLANCWRRLAQPLAVLPRMTRIVLAGAPPLRAVPQGEPSRLFVAVAARSGPLPATVDWRLDGGGRGRSPVTPDGVCRIALPALARPSTLAIACGDARVRCLLKPARRPELLALHAVTDSLGDTAGHRMVLIPGVPRLSVPAGSRLRLAGQADRRLADVRLWLAGKALVPPASASGDHFAADLGPLTADTEIGLAWQAGDGLWGHGPLRLSVAVQPDRAPTLNWGQAGLPETVRADAIVALTVTAADDRGLVRCELHVDGVGGQRLTQAMAAPGAPRQAEVTLRLCPADLGLLAGQSLRVEASAQDAVSGREPSRLVAVLPVVGNAARSTDLAGRARRLWQDLEPIAVSAAEQAERERAAASAAVATTVQEEVASAGLRLAESHDARLREVAGDLADLVAAALATPGFDDEVSAAWAEAGQALDTLSRQALPALLRALRPAAAIGVAAGDRLAAAWPRRAEMAAVLRAILAADDAFRRCGVRTAALRLQELAQAEQIIATELTDLPDTWAGQDLGQLGASDCQRLHELAERQRQAAADLRASAALLRDLAAGGAPEPYGRVAASIDRSGLAGDLELAAEQTRRNHRFLALSTAEEGAQQLATWAKALLAEAADAAGGGGQGGAPGGMGAATLRLQRLLLAQESLRERTARVAELAVSGSLRAEMTQRLGAHQGRLADGLPELSRICPGPLVAVLDQAGAAMGAAAGHLRTGQLAPALAAQAQASEWLHVCLQSTRAGAGAAAGGSLAAAGAGGVALGQAGARPPDEAPLPGDRTSPPPGPQWTGGRPDGRGQAVVRADALALVPAAYRNLWEHYRRRLEEGAP